jgi:hypothetical protein
MTGARCEGRVAIVTGDPGGVNTQIIPTLLGPTAVRSINGAVVTSDGCWMSARGASLPDGQEEAMRHLQPERDHVGRRRSEHLIRGGASWHHGN